MCGDAGECFEARERILLHCPHCVADPEARGEINSWMGGYCMVKARGILTAKPMQL